MSDMLLVGIVAAVTTLIIDGMLKQLFAERAYRHQLRIAALDKRIATHQQAYTLWRKIIKNIDQHTITDVALECQEWWEHNCLYLTPEARIAFHTCYMRAFQYKSHLLPPFNAELATEDMESIRKAGLIITRSVTLVDLGEDETKLLPHIGT